MTFEISDLSTLEILDSQGSQTFATTATLADGSTGHAEVVTGRSGGIGHVRELRRRDSTQFAEFGALGLATAATDQVRERTAGRTWADLAELDGALGALGAVGSPSMLATDSLFAISMAIARALALAEGLPLFKWLATSGQRPRLPVPFFNMLNGGRDAPNALEFQEFMICPLGARTEREAVRAGAAAYRALRNRLAWSGYATSVDDQGGFAGEIDGPRGPLRLLVGAIEDAGYEAGSSGIAIALDVAASEFRQPDGRYRVASQTFTTDEMISFYDSLVNDFPIWSITDGLGEDDTEGWLALTRCLGERVQIVGDDVFGNDPAMIATVAANGLANAAVVNPHQIGTITGTLDAMAICRHNGYAQIIAQRSGETADDFIADLAVGLGSGQLASGAPARGQRVVKYLRLLEIGAAEPTLPYGLAPR